MPIHRYRLGPMDNNTYLIVDTPTKDTALVDPSFDSEAIWKEIQSQHWNLKFILNTHAHFDHVLGNAFYVRQSGAPLALHTDDLEILRALPEQGRRFNVPVEPSPDPDIFLEDGQTLDLGETTLRVLHTPGHSPGGVTFLVEDAAIVGDCLFAGSIGRTDLPGASQETLLRAIQTKLLTLPDATRVLPGHGALTTIETEKRANPFLKRVRER